MAAKVPMSETGTDDQRDQRRPPVLEEEDHDEDHEQDSHHRVWITARMDSRMKAEVS